MLRGPPPALGPSCAEFAKCATHKADAQSLKYRTNMASYVEAWYAGPHKCGAPPRQPMRCKRRVALVWTTFLGDEVASVCKKCGAHQ